MYVYLQPGQSENSPHNDFYHPHLIFIRIFPSATHAGNFRWLSEMEYKPKKTWIRCNWGWRKTLFCLSKKIKNILCRYFRGEGTTKSVRRSKNLICAKPGKKRVSNLSAVFQHESTWRTTWRKGMLCTLTIPSQRNNRGRQVCCQWMESIMLIAVSSNLVCHFLQSYLPLEPKNLDVVKKLEVKNKGEDFKKL